MPDNSEINEQFKSSLKAIEELQSTILKLSNLQSSQEQSSQSLITASEKLNELTDSLKTATPEIQETLVSVSESLDTAQQFLAKTDLTGIIKHVEELSAGQAALSDENKELLSWVKEIKTLSEGQTAISGENKKLLSILSELKGEVLEKSKEADKQREAAESELKELKAKIGTLNDRSKRKLNL